MNPTAVLLLGCRVEPALPEAAGSARLLILLIHSLDPHGFNFSRAGLENFNFSVFDDQSFSSFGIAPMWNST